MRSLALALCVLAAVAGCTPRAARQFEEEDPSARRGGIPPATLAPVEQPPALDPRADAAPPNPQEPAPQPDATGTPPPDVPEWRVLAEVTDPVGDAGAEAPSYADLVAVVVSDDGTRVRVVIDMAGDVPPQLADGEVLGIGFDVFTEPDATESDHQLFADGGSDGWTAYLQGPDGIVDYPGSFRIGGRRIVFEVPWSAIGDPGRASFRVFADWSQRRRLLNATGHDRAPDDGTVPLAR